MFSNCIKYNTAAESTHYREEACRQRDRFKKLYVDAANRIEAHMDPNRDGAKSITSNKVVPMLTRTKRKELNSKTDTHPHKKKLKVESRCNTDTAASSSNSIVSAPTVRSTVAQREKILLTQNWQPKRTSQSKTNWISPGLKRQFRFLKAAEEFNRLREKYHGDEAAALKAYSKIIEKRPQKASYFLVGGMSSFDNNVSIDNSEDMKVEESSPISRNAHWERHNALLSKGWTIKHGSYSHGKQLLKESPQLKLQFISTREAEDFEKDRQKCRGDEYKASSLFKRRLIQQGRDIAKILVNGKSALSFGDKTTATDNQRRMALESKGWEYKKMNRNLVLKLSPSRKIKFKSTKAAEEFEKARQECEGDEYEASKLFCKRAREKGMKVASAIEGGLTALFGLNSKNKCRELLESKVYTRREALKSDKVEIDTEVSCSLLFDVYLCALCEIQDLTTSLNSRQTVASNLKRRQNSFIFNETMKRSKVVIKVGVWSILTNHMGLTSRNHQIQLNELEWRYMNQVPTIPYMKMSMENSM